MSITEHLISSRNECALNRGSILRKPQMCGEVIVSRSQFEHAGKLRSVLVDAVSNSIVEV